MNYLLLIVGFSCCIAGVLFRKNACKKKSCRFCIIFGALCMFFFLFLLLLNVKAALMMQICMVAILSAIPAFDVNLKDFRPVSKKLTPRQNIILKYSLLYVISSVLIVSFINFVKFPTVKLENGSISMSGRFGGDFEVADITSIDTVRTLPRLGKMSGGGSGFGYFIGNFEVKDEDKLGKLCFWTRNPPYIAIRMNDNLLFLLNFRKPEKTVEFYEKIINELNSN